MDYQSPKHVEYSRWASEEEIKASLHKVYLGDFDTEYGGIPLYADSEAVYLEHDDCHSLTTSLTGSKKSRAIVMPALRLCAHAGESIVATDPKGELYERTLPLLMEKGYNVKVINLRNPRKSNCWNPLTVPYKLYKNGERDLCLELLRDMANCIVEEAASREPFWHNSAGDLLVGLLMILFECAREDEIHLKSLRTLRAQAFNVNSSSKNEFPYIKEHFLDHIKKSAFVYSLVCGTAEVGDTTRGCIVSTFDQAMTAFFSQDNLNDMLSYSDFEMKDIGKSKTAIFLITPDENTVYNKLITIFVKQCYTELIREAHNHPGLKLPVRVNFILDEFANLPAIADFPAMITAARSRNIRFNLIIQDLQQLKYRYGVNAETIKGNCENWIYLHSRDITIIDELISLAGKKSCDEPLLTVSMLQTMDKNKNQALVFHKRLHPYMANLKDIDEYHDFSKEKNKVEYPENKRKADEIFDFVKFCRQKGEGRISLLFLGKTPEEIEREQEQYYMASEADMYETIFTSKVPSDEEIKEKIGAYDDNNAENEKEEDNGVEKQKPPHKKGKKKKKIKTTEFLSKLTALAEKYGYVIKHDEDDSSYLIERFMREG